jgi:branched-chain amino acid transport system ATP-binding protein
MTLLSTQGLTRRFGGLTAVDNIAFDLPKGQIRAVIGPNGAGKTTFVGLLCGRLLPDQGSIMFNGRDITRMPAHQRVAHGIAYTFQITSVFARLSLYDNVALAAQRRLRRGRGRSRDLRQQTMTALERVGLSNQAHALAGHQSYGHQRLLEVAMGLALHPALLILDEPTQGLADGEITRFVALVREVAKDATILLIEHNMDVVLALADVITVFNLGAVLAEGTPAAIQADQAVQAAYLGG